MKFEVCSFKKLLGMRFNIPNYQRGYRWEKENVEALLNDIQEFAKKTQKKTEEFYCLQPVVVTKNKFLSEKEGVDVYDLLDGQQRLTTLWLILNSSKFNNLWSDIDESHQPLYALQYESRENLFEEALNPDSNPLDNIDLFYLKKAISTIKEWKGSPLKVLSALVPNDSDNNSNDVKIIWYEFESASNVEKTGKKHASSIKVFSRLNYGKIGLTDTELIKALILQNDIYPEDTSKHNRGIMKEHLFRISTEWDDIEKAIHSGQLWGMIAPKEYDPANHIELLLQFVADQIQSEQNYSIFDNNRRDFHIIYNFLLGEDGMISADKYAEKVDDLWKRITDAFNAINNWYINDDYYHLIGLLVMLKGGTNPIHLIKEIFENYTNKNDDKSGFKQYLEMEIGKAIKIVEKDNDNEKGGKLKLYELIYGPNSKRIIKILEATNIYLHITAKSIESRFNFKKFKDFNVTSLEHIHPQHLNFEDNVTIEDINNWYDTTDKTITTNAEYSKEEILTKALNELSELIKSKDIFEKNITRCQELTEIIDNYFDKKAGMTDGHMNTLYNMALVDKDTNAALSNHLIDSKRSILQQRANELKTYVPIATEYVFNKHFSSEVSDMKLWTEKDRKSYYSIVEKAYNYFTSKI